MANLSRQNPLTPPEQNKRNWQILVCRLKRIQAVLLDPKRLWREIVTWPVVSTIVVLGIGSGIGVLSMTPPLFFIAKVCFILSTVIFLAKVVHWLILSNSGRIEKTVLAFLILGSCLVVLVGALKWISRNQAQYGDAIDERSLLVHEASMSGLLYPTGTLIGSIPWQQNLVDVRLFLHTGGMPIQNLDLEIKLDDGMEKQMGIAAVTETIGIPCIFLPEMFPGVPALSRTQLFGQVETDEKGNRVTTPANVVQIIAPLYRVQCSYVQKNTALSLIIAAADQEPGASNAISNPPLARRFPSTISTNGTFETYGPSGVIVHHFAGSDKLEIGK